MTWTAHVGAEPEAQQALVSSCYLAQWYRQECVRQQALTEQEESHACTPACL